VFLGGNEEIPKKKLKKTHLFSQGGKEEYRNSGNEHLSGKTAVIEMGRGARPSEIA